MRILTVAALAALLACGPVLATGPYENLPDAKGTLPEGVVQLSPVVPKMGEHWGNPKDMPLGPIYCVHEGKIVCLEFMIAQEDFAAGKSWTTLASAIPGLPPVNHLSIFFEEKGHEGYEVPHYDLHLFFISPEEVEAITP